MVVGVAASTQTQVTELQNDKKFHRANREEKSSTEQIRGKKKIIPSKTGKKVQRANRDEKRYNEQIGIEKTVQRANRQKSYTEKIGRTKLQRPNRQKKSYLANQDINFHRN